MSTRLTLTALPGFEADLRALPTIELQKMALGLLVEVRNGTVHGVRLDSRVATGERADLAVYRSISARLERGDEPQ